MKAENLKQAKHALLGIDIAVAVGQKRGGVFQGYPGIYQIVGLTRRTVIVAPHAASGKLNLLRKVSLSLETGESRHLYQNDVYHVMRPSDLQRIRGAMP